MNNLDRETIREYLDGKRIFTIPYAHCDYAAIHTRNWHKARNTAIIFDVLAILKTNPDFRWYFDCYRSQLHDFVQRYPEKVKEINSHIDAGRIAICGAFSNLRPNMVGEETYIRNIEFGRKKFKELFPNANLSVYAEEVDVALGHPQIPQLMRQFGYELYRCYRPNEVMDMKNISNEFIWEGLDGSRLMVSRGDYAAFCYQGTDKLMSEDDTDKIFDYVYENIKCFLNFCRSDIIWVSCGGDDCLPLHVIVHSTKRGEDPNEYIDMPGIIDKWNRNEKAPMRFASPIEFLHELKKVQDTLSIVKNTIDPCDVSYNICLNGEKGLWALRLKGERIITGAQKWSGIAHFLRMHKYDYHFDALWENVLMCSAHASQWLFTHDFENFKGILNHTVYEADKIQREIIQDIVKYIGHKSNTMSIVFNNTQFLRREYIQLCMPCTDPDQLVLRDGLDRVVPFQVMKSYDFYNTWEYEILVYIELPPMGYNLIYVDKGDVSARSGKTISIKESHELGRFDPDKRFDFKAGEFILTFESGNLLEIVGGTSDVNLVTTKTRPWNLISYHEYNYKGTWGEEPGPEKVDIVWEKYQVVETGPLRHVIRLWGVAGIHPVVQDIMVFHDKNEILFECIVNWKRCNGFMTASIPITSGDHMIGDMPFGQEVKNMQHEYNEEFSRTEYPHRSRDGVFCAKQFVYNIEDNMRLAMCRISSDRYFRYDRKHKTLGNILINSIIRTKGTWEEDINPEIEGVGEHRFKYAFMFDKLDQNMESLHKKSMCLIDEPVVIEGSWGESTKEGLLPCYNSFMELIPENIMISSVFARENNMVIRLWETEGRYSSVSLKLPFPIFSAHLEDLTGNEYKERVIAVNGNKVSFEIKPWEIATFSCNNGHIGVSSNSA